VSDCIREIMIGAAHTRIIQASAPAWGPYIAQASASTADPMFEAYRIMNEVSGGRVVKVEMERLEPPLDSLGPLVTVTVDADAREALEMYVRAAREVRGKGFVLEVRWTREMNVSAEELIRYAVRALVEMEIPLFIDPDFDSVKAVRGARGRRPPRPPDPRSSRSSDDILGATISLHMLYVPV